MSDQSTLVQDNVAKENVNPANSEAPSQDTWSSNNLDPHDFIMRLHGTETYWPAILLASALIAVSIIFLVSLAFGSGIG